MTLNVALLGSAEIQSVNGLDELTGGSTDLRWLYLVALASGTAFVVQQRRVDNPLFDPRLFQGRNLRAALFVNFVVGAGLVIAMVDVPLFINSVEVDLERAAVYAGWTLSALTAAMAVTSYLGGRATERWWFRPPVLAGVAMSTLAYAWMGASWTSDTSYPVFALQLALLGGGFGLTVAPTTSAVVDAAPEDQRGAAASIVMVVRLLGLSVGLSALTAWGLSRFNHLRGTIDLPSLTDPGFEAALLEAQETLTAQAIAETFTAAAVVLGAGLLATFAMRRITSDGDTTMTEQPDHPESPEHPEHPESPELGVVPGTTSNSEVAVLGRRVNVMIGLVALLLVGALATIALLFGRVANAEDDASTARSELEATRAELLVTKDDLNRVEAGAALYASQITGFQEQLVELEPQVSAGVDEAIVGLREFGESTLAFDVNIDEMIPIETEVVLKRIVEVPIKTSIPINETIETTIQVDTRLGFSVPIDVTVPVNLSVPIDLVVEIPIDETVPISEEFAVKLAVPIEIDVRETALADLTDSLAAGLEALQKVLKGLGG